MSQLTFDSGSGWSTTHARSVGRKGGCRDFGLAQPDVDSDLADSLWEQDLTLLRAARKVTCNCMWTRQET